MVRRHRHRRRVAGALLGAALLAGACGDGGPDGPASGTETTASESGLRGGALEPVPDAELPEGGLSELRFTRFDGSEGTFGDYTGRFMVVNFWASWCAPCIREMPEFEEVYQEVRPDVAFVGVNVGDRIEDATVLAERTGVTYDLVRDPRSELLRAFGGVAMPTTAFVAPDGSVLDVVSRLFTKEQLAQRIEELR